MAYRFVYVIFFIWNVISARPYMNKESSEISRASRK